MRVNIHLLTVLNSEYFHPTISHCIFMCILGFHSRDMAAMLVVNAIHHFHIDHNAPSIPPPPKSLHDHCSQFLLGITVVPREIQDNSYEKFGGGGG